MLCQSTVRLAWSSKLRLSEVNKVSSNKTRLKSHKDGYTF
jgi:hypothetical protein